MLQCGLHEAFFKNVFGVLKYGVLREAIRIHHDGTLRVLEMLDEAGSENEEISSH